MPLIGSACIAAAFAATPPAPKLSMAEAETIALKTVDGQITSEEYELEDGVWRYSFDIKVGDVNRPRVEVFYWATITFSQTLGTALGDWAADSGLGYLGGAAVFAAALAAIVMIYYATRLSRVALFWTAFILTRPLGATVGDFFDKPLDQGGLNMSRPIATAVIAVFIVFCILVIPQRAGSHPGTR
jgi:uncharacterized membrane-anchored protein